MKYYGFSVTMLLILVVAESVEGLDKMNRGEMIELLKNKSDLTKTLVLVNCEDSHLEEDHDCQIILNTLKT